MTVSPHDEIARVDCLLYILLQNLNICTVLQELLGVVVDAEVQSDQNGGEDRDQPDQLAEHSGLGQVAETMQSGLLAVENAWGRREPTFIFIKKTNLQSSTCSIVEWLQIEWQNMTGTVIKNDGMKR